MLGHRSVGAVSRRGFTDRNPLWTLPIFPIRKRAIALQFQSSGCHDPICPSASSANQRLSAALPGVGGARGGWCSRAGGCSRALGGCRMITAAPLLVPDLPSLIWPLGREQFFDRYWGRTLMLQEGAA